ncbi:thiamine-phosphate kinase [Thiohalorhabdus denitrificans]|uniref:Thiamine-monophosphate kinase n=1 Tax=Thiohalorhabdus denitrificans TaxID=381306 RepID=A0A1G5GH17_9GAMM|nr:thiamine-phosphate kinase [Thiohalorhabdus denitrificans]SCY50794.1 thiamine-monophosphate kinase [Thiohalorhabdus denitrificans]
MTDREGRIGTAGEFALIEELFHRDRSRPADVHAGIGDDAALLAHGGDADWVAAVDTVEEGVHALPGGDAAALGWKAVAVNVSDLAAMGARPRHALLAASLPKDLARERAGLLADGLQEALETWGIALVGGDTVATPGPLALSLTLLGRVAPERALRRDGARPGETVYVTGTLGDAAAGLELLRDPPADWLPAYDLLVERHLRPRPPLAYGQGIAGVASAAIDVSDGLLADLRHLASASGVGLELDTARLPLSAPMGEWSWATGRDPLPLALSGGEDFELVFAAGEEAFEGIHRAKYEADTRFTPIGRVVAERPGEVFGAGVPGESGGYDHFPAEERDGA